MTNPIKILDEHHVTLTREDEITIEDRRYDPDYDSADLAVRTCICTQVIESYEDYNRHLREALAAAID